jgi:hypothetical protein
MIGSREATRGCWNRYGPDIPPTGCPRKLCAALFQLMLRYASVQRTQRYLNVTDEELGKGLEVSWKRRTLKVVGG